jgi:hypothetical protein
MSFGRPYIVGIDGCVHDGWLVISDYEDSLDVNYLYTFCVRIRFKSNWRLWQRDRPFKI